MVLAVAFADRCHDGTVAAALSLIEAALSLAAALLCDQQAFNLFQPSYDGAMQAGGAALYEDGFPYTQPWPFQVEEITTPVSLWHGTQDANFHIAKARNLAARLQNVQFHKRNEGHYSLPFNCAGEMLADLTSKES